MASFKFNENPVKEVDVAVVVAGDVCGKIELLLVVFEVLPKLNALPLLADPNENALFAASETLSEADPKLMAAAC